MPDIERRSVEMTIPLPLKGSVVDMSHFVEAVPAGAHGRLIRTPEGHFALSIPCHLTLDSGSLPRAASKECKMVKGCGGHPGTNTSTGTIEAAPLCPSG